VNYTNPDPLPLAAEPATTQPSAELRPEPALETPTVGVFATSATDASVPGVPRRALPPDLRVPWGWLDLLWFLLFGVLSSMVLTWVVELAAMAIFHTAAPNIKNGDALSPIVLVIGQGLWSGAALLYLYAVVRVRSAEPFWRTIGWRALPSSVAGPGGVALRFAAGGAVMAVAVSVIGRYGGQNGELPIEKLFDSRGSVVMLMSLGILVAPLVEETIFRGFLYPLVARQFGVPVGIVVTGLVFGMMHAAQLWGGWTQIALLIIVGIVLTWVRARTRTVAASYFVHLGYNSLLFLGFVVATGGLRHFTD
jgi:membrane protease YdiL (CAAX protease family)